MSAFTIIVFFVVAVMGSVMYIRFSMVSRQETVESTQKLMEQTGESMEDYLISMRQISDAVYYNVIKENDVSSQSEELREGMNLLYEANRDSLRSIAIYNYYGSLIAAEPVAVQKEAPDVTRQEWFERAVEEMENIQFSTPHIQNLFDDGSLRYYWVISSSRVVELNNEGRSQQGVLLVDMDYSNISRMMTQINELNGEQYFYLCDSDGEIIFHPQQVQLSKGMYSENNQKIAGYKEGVYDEIFQGERQKVIVNTISYTGWKLVGVIPYSIFFHELVDIRYFILILTLIIIMIFVYINRLVSVWISSPILKLNESVMEYEAGKKPQIYIGGSQEIRHLGYSIQSSYERSDLLMQKVILEQNERRKSELDALQSQINPHFLYNALDSIIWMIEAERNDEATFMISQLAKLFRISLSKGHTIISVRDELQHAESYMNLQRIRYRDSFSVSIAIDPELYSCCFVKLTLQPILENAINYGVSGMDGEGEIHITGWREDGNIILSVTDNGIGMSKEEVALLLTDSDRVHKHGSGVGLVNVNSRIRIFFGDAYGLRIESEPDEGTTVFICIPEVEYSEENREILEKGYLFSQKEMNGKKEQGGHDEGQ